MPGALIVTTVSGFLPKFESDNVSILKSLGYEVHYAANPKERVYEFPDDIFDKLGVSFHPIAIAKSPYRTVTNLKALFEIKRIIKEEEIELIHCHTPTGGLVGRIAVLFASFKNKRSIHVMYTAHGLHFYKGAPLKNHLLYGTVERMLARITDDIILINKEDYDTAQGFKLRKGGRAYLIPGIGLSRDEFRPYTAEEREKARKKLDIDETDFLLVSVGEINDNKNHAIVLEALNKMITSEAGNCSIKYMIAGEGDLRKKLQETTKKYDIDNIVTLCGYCPAQADDPDSEIVLQELLGAADAFCFPSIREGLGMAPLEALAMGVPVLAAENRGTREYMQDGKNGYVCKWNDADSWISGIRRIMALSESDKEKLSLYCRESTTMFDKSITSKKMKEVYERARESTYKKYIQR